MICMNLIEDLPPKMDENEPLSGQSKKPVRGKGRGGLFFALDREQWQSLWQLETANRFNMAAAYLVLLAGTGSDHRLTKWSAKAIEEYVGIGKPRGQRAIQELVDHGVISHTERSTRLAPQYELANLDRDAEPIFLPVQLITGLAGESPILRRLREIGDPLVLRMLIDLYGLVEVDATYGVPYSVLRKEQSFPAQKLFDMGANTVWSMELGDRMQGAGDWATPHRSDNPNPWDYFRERVVALVNIGAIWFEPWVFDGEGSDAEPLFPATADVGDAAELSELAYDAAVSLAGERSYYIERASGDVLIPLPSHQRAPEIRGVAKLRVEADTPGRRMAYAQRMNRIESYSNGYRILGQDASMERFDKPLIPVNFDKLPRN